MIRNIFNEMTSRGIYRLPRDNIIYRVEDYQHNCCSTQSIEDKTHD